MKLLIVRHAQSNGNASRDYSVATHDSLSSDGEEQAGSLAKILTAFTFDKVVVSPLQRAMETLVPYLSATRQKAEIWPEIAEGCWQKEREGPSGSWTSQPDRLSSRFSPHFTFRNNVAIRPSDQETFGEGLCRVHETSGLLLEEANKKTGSLLMVAHGNFNRELLNHLLMTSEPLEFHHDNCGMTSLDFDGEWHLNFLNTAMTFRVC